MDELFSKVKFNKSLLNKLVRQRTKYIYKNVDHTEFFSGNLTGVHIVRFTNKDFDSIFKELLRIDPLKVDKIIRSSDNFNHEYKVEGDAFNHTVTYMAHRFLTSPDLKEKDRLEGALESIMFFLLRSIAALISSRFIYPADKAVAKRTYELLSNKYLIKQLGSWYGVLQYRADQAVSKDGLHQKTLINFNEDDRVKYILTDLATRMSDLVKNIYSVHMVASDEGVRVKETNMIGLDHDGELMFKESTGGEGVYLQNVQKSITDDQLLRPRLVPIIMDIIPTTTETNLKELIGYIGQSYYSDQNQLLKEFVEGSINYCVEYTKNHRLLSKYRKDLGKHLLKLKGALSSSRSSDPKLLELRDTGSDVIGLLPSHYTDQQVAATRTAAILYLYLLAYSGVHFT